MLPIVKSPIERPTVQVPVILEDASADAGDIAPAHHNALQLGGAQVAPAAPAVTSVFVRECGLCAARTGREVWTATPPDRPDDEEAWVTLLEANVHASCLAQAFAEKLITNIPLVERSLPAHGNVGVEEHREFATRCLEPRDKLPMECVVDGTCPPFQWDLEALVKQHGQMEIGLTALQPMATGFRLFPEIAPPRTLEDLLQCTSKQNRNGRLAESSIPLDMKSKFPDLYPEFRKSIPPFALPGGPCDILWKDSRNRTRISSPKLSILSPGSVLRAERSRYRTATWLLTSGSVIEWGGINIEDAEKVLEASRELRSKTDPTWLPDLAFCVRHGARVFCGQQTQSGQMMLAFPGCISWAFVRGSTSTHIVQWSFAERSKLAFEYALSDPLCASHPEELLELDLEFARQDVLNLKFFHELLKIDEERLGLLPKDLAELLVARLVRACQDTPVDATRGLASAVPADHARKTRCDECRAELFERRVMCSECEREGQNPDGLIDLVATHPPRSNAKKDRSTLPDWLRVGCRVLVNLTVSGNSNDKPPRVIGAAHLPAIILKTGHGFFTVYLEGAGEQVVKRKAAIEPHPHGPQLAEGFSVKIKAEGGGGGAGNEPVIQTTPFRACVYCADCFVKVHANRGHPKKSAVYIDGRQELARNFELWKREIAARSAIRKDDLCVWHMRSSNVEGEHAEEEPLPPCSVLLRSVSPEAGQDAMARALIMGPSPYHYPATGANPGSSSAGSTSPLGQRNMAAAHAALAPQTLIAGSGMERRSRQAAKRRLFGSDPMAGADKPALGRKDEQVLTSNSASSGRLSAPSSSLGQYQMVGSKRVRLMSATSASAGNGGWEERIQPENDMYTSGLMEAHLNQAGLGGLPTTHQGMNLALQSGSFFVGGHKSLAMLLEADAIVQTHAELLHASKPEEIRAIWAQARNDIPLKKMWRFLAIDATTAQPPMAHDASSGSSSSPSSGPTLIGHLDRKLSKREAIHALAESAANAEPAPEVA